MSQPHTTTPLQTRQKSLATTTKKTQKELENAEGINTNVRNKQQALTFLQKKEYLVPGKPVDLQTLSHILLQFGNAAIKVPKTLTDGIRAVAILIADARAQQMAEEITTAVKIQLQEQMETFNTHVENMRDTVEHVTEAAKEITERMDEFKEEFQGSTEEILQVTQDLAEKTADNATERQGAPTQRMQQPTYTTITQQQTIPAAHITVITRGEMSNKQILIQKDPNTTDNILDSLTEKDLVAKANTTLDLMGIEAKDCPITTDLEG
jgi:gas vesicle protein